MAAYAPEPYPAPLHTRSRRSSTASQRYHPDSYTPSPPQAPPLTPAGYPYAYGKPAPPTAMPPMDPRSSYGPPPGQSIAPDVHPATAAYSPFAVSARAPYPLSDVDAVVDQPILSDTTTRRQSSYNSMHSKRSQDSHKSHDSRRSRDSHRARKGHRSSDEEVDRERRHRRRDDKERRHRHNNDHDSRHVRRGDTHRPSLGETLWTVIDGIKTALGPRDSRY